MTSITTWWKRLVCWVGFHKYEREYIKDHPGWYWIVCKFCKKGKKP